MALISTCNCGSIPVRDATPLIGTRVDPTGTAAIRRAFRSEMDRRWEQVRRAVSKMVRTDNILGLGKDHLGYVHGGDKVLGFQAWLDELMRRVVLQGDGSWMDKYIQMAVDRAKQRSSQLVTSDLQFAQTGHRMAREQALRSATMTELQGIVEAVSQQALRALTESFLGSHRPMRAGRNVSQRIISIGKMRGRALVEFSVVKAFNSSTLDAFRSAGIRTVGINAERKVKVQQTAHGKALVADARGVTGPGSRIPRTRSPSGSTIRRIKQAQAKIQALEEVDVITAGDDDVCPECEDISDEGPYDIDEAESLIPAHPYCRCAFIPVNEES